MAIPSGSSRATLDKNSISGAPLSKPSKPRIIHAKSKSDSKEVLEKSNIKVVVRLRGASDKDKLNKLPNAVYIPEGSTKEIKFINESYDKREPPTFKFDKVFGSQTSQQEFFETVAAPLVEEVLNGFNCTLFAYGQTGTGKTHTMEGNLSTVEGSLCPDAGIIPRVLELLFKKLDSIEDNHSVRLSMLEIYNEEVGDLFSLDKTVPKLNMNVDGTGKLIIQGQEEIIVDDVERGIQLLKTGSSKRNISATEMNSRSSRSHCIFTLTVRIKMTLRDSPDVLKEGKLHLVDLAGSENAKTSSTANVQARETGAINQSLLALGRVINALATKEESNNPVHVPYRESKLTRILQDSLGGKTKTCLIATISPSKVSLDETNNTLKYASKAMKITNTPITNQKVAPSSEIRRLKEEVTHIRKLYEIAIEDNNKRVTFDEYIIVKNQCDEQTNVVRELQEKLKILKEESSLATAERNKALSALESKNSTFLKAQTDLKTSRYVLAQIDEKFGIKEEDLEETIEALMLKEKEGESVKAEIHQVRQQMKELSELNMIFSENERKNHKLNLELNERLRKRTYEAEFLQNKIARLSSLENKNRTTLLTMKDSCLALHSSVCSQFDSISSTQKSFIKNLESELSELLEKHNNKLNFVEFEKSCANVKSISGLLQSASEDQASDASNMLESLNLSLNTLDSSSEGHLSQVSELFKDIKLSSQITITNFMAKLMAQQNSLLLTLKNYESSFLSQLTNHRSRIESFVLNIQIDGKDEVDYWKTQTIRLQASLDEHQRELPRRLEELKHVINSNIDKFANFGQKLTSTSSIIINDSNLHISAREEFLANPPSGVSVIQNNIKTIMDDQTKLNAELDNFKETSSSILSELPLINEDILKDTTSILAHKFNEINGDMKKNIEIQKQLSGGFESKIRNHKDKQNKSIQKITDEFDMMNKIYKNQGLSYSSNITSFSNNTHSSISELNIEFNPFVDSGLTSLTESNHILKSHIPGKLESDIPTSKTPTQLEECDFSDQWISSNIEPDLSQFNSSSPSPFTPSTNPHSPFEVISEKQFLSSVSYH